jgi:hypothetical protein
MIGVPGLAKTMMVKALAELLGWSSAASSSLPTCCPAMSLGVSVYNTDQRNFEFKPGPIFANIVLPMKSPVEKRALVIGGGISGIQAALDVSLAGYKVTLVERLPTIGGRMAQLEKPFQPSIALPEYSPRGWWNHPRTRTSQSIPTPKWSR